MPHLLLMEFSRRYSGHNNSTQTCNLSSASLQSLSNHLIPRPWKNPKARSSYLELRVRAQSLAVARQADCTKALSAMSHRRTNGECGLRKWKRNIHDTTAPAQLKIEFNTGNITESANSLVSALCHPRERRLSHIAPSLLHQSSRGCLR